MELKAYQFVNLNNIYICFSIRIKTSTNNANDTDHRIITVNNVSVHWIKETEARRLGDL